MSIANLKRSSNSKLKQIQTNIQNENSKRSYADNRYWSPVVDKNGNGSAIIRFLPGILVKDVDNPNYDTPYLQSLILSGTVEDEPLYEPPYVKMWKHGFKDPQTSQWYIENNRNSLGTDEDRVTDPCTDYNASLWKTEDAGMREQARRQKRKLLYISNIQVIKHAARETDEGRVFLFAYGKKIFEKLESAVNPDAGDGVEPVDIFNFWKGANFHLKVRNYEGYRNYDTSSFLAPKPLSESDEELEAIFNQEHSLFDEVSADKFKSYEELERQLFRVLNIKDEEPPREQPRSRPTAVAPKPRAVDDDELVSVPFDVDDDGVVTDKVASTSPDAKAFFKGLSTNKA